MKALKALTNFNLSGFFKNVKYLYRTGVLRIKHYRARRVFYEGEDFKLWGLYIVPSFISLFPRLEEGLVIELKPGKLKSPVLVLTRNTCDNSPKVEVKSEKPEDASPKANKKKVKRKVEKHKSVVLKERLDRAKKRIFYSKHCGAKGNVVAMTDKLTGVRFAAYLPVHCHSIFCPRCASEWSREVKNRIRYAFENEKEVNFITLTIPNRECKSFEETYDAINDIMSYLTEVYNIKLTDRFLSRLNEAFKHECKALYENVKKKRGWREARKSVANQVKHYKSFIRILKSFKGHKLGQVINAVWRLEVVSRIEDDKLILHPHFHGLTSAPAPKLFWQAVWGMVVGCPVITDARVMKAEVVAEYTSEYEAKPEEPPSGKGSLSLENARLWVEGALLNRQRIRVWGFASPKIKVPEEMKLYSVRSLYPLVAYLRIDKPLPDRLSCWLKCKREGIERFFITRGSIVDRLVWEEFEISLYYDVRYGFIIDGLRGYPMPSLSSMPIP